MKSWCGLLLIVMSLFACAPSVPDEQGKKENKEETIVQKDAGLQDIVGKSEPVPDKAPSPEPVREPSLEPGQEPQVEPSREPPPAPEPAKEPRSEPDLTPDAGAEPVPEKRPPVPPIPKVDPFAPQKDVSEGLINTSKDLKQLLENGALKNACQLWALDPTNRKKKLLCGKAMFFYEPFGTAGIPKAVVRMLLNKFGNEVGKGFSKYGMIPDPYSTENLPLGMASSGKLQGKVETYALTCASCHFAKMPDGRYSVGAPNHKYEYGKHMLAVSLFPLVVSGQARGDRLQPTVQKAILPLLQKIWKDPLLRVSATVDLLGLATSGVKIPTFSEPVQKEYASWPAGTMDFITEPLPLNDKVHTVSKINALWNIPTPAERKKAGMVHAMLGWTGGTHSLARFIEDFVSWGGGNVAAWPASKRSPLVEYIHSLRAPKPPTTPPATSVQRGKQLFASKGCLQCHSGPRGSGKRVYTFQEIGTDDAIKKWMDPDLDGKICCNIKLPPGEKLTHGIKSPRLVGLWSMSRFLHNGALNSLDELFCLKGPRPPSKGHALGTQGHTMTCNGLTAQEKIDLMNYLLSH